MCFDIGSSVNASTSKTRESNKENKDTNKVAKIQRLFETKGYGDGQQISANQGKSVKRIFGN